MSHTEILLNYETRAIAFIDVMGFKELLFSPNSPIDLLQDYYRNASEFLDGKSATYNMSAPEDSFKKLFVSDSIILSVKFSSDQGTNTARIARFFNSIALLQYTLATKSKIWTRGAVSIGDLCINERQNVLVGPAFVQAYELEKLADYPRIIIDPKLLKYFGHNQKEFIKKINQFELGGNLIGINQTQRIGLSPFGNDAIQIDWFRHSFEREDNLDGFFSDLSSRQYLNQNLFGKANRLIRYLQESLHLYLDTHSLHESSKKPSRVKAIEAELNKLI